MFKLLKIFNIIIKGVLIIFFIFYVINNTFFPFFFNYQIAFIIINFILLIILCYLFIHCRVFQIYWPVQFYFKEH